MEKALDQGLAYQIGDFKVLLSEDGSLKVTAISSSKDNIRIEPISANNIKLHACK